MWGDVKNPFMGVWESFMGLDPLEGK